MAKPKAPWGLSLRESTILTQDQHRRYTPRRQFSRIGYPQHVKAVPDSQLPNEGQPEDGQGSPIIQVRELGLRESMAAKHALESGSGIHPIHGAAPVIRAG